MTDFWHQAADFFPLQLQDEETWDAHGGGGGEGRGASTSNIEESNAREGKQYRFTHPADNPFFPHESFKGGNWSTTPQNPNGLS